MKLKVLFIMLALFSTIILSQSSANYKIKNPAFSQGNNSGTSASFKIVSTTGQAGPIGKSNNTTMILNSGFINQDMLNSYLMERSIIAIATGWNLISIPLTLDNMEVSSVFPYAASNAFRYSNGYSIASSFENGKGYWLKFTNGATPSIELTGLKSTQNINLSVGWNIIGLTEKNIAVSNISTLPAGIITSNFFGYNNGYVVPDTLKSGKGYWIKVNQSGVINLAGSGSAKENYTATEISSDWARLQVTDAGGKEGVLFISNNETDLSNFELPPVPPAGVFDLRFAGDRYVEELFSGSKDVRINSAEYPVTIIVIGAELKITDLIGGKIINELIKPGGSLTINNPSIESLRIEKVTIPEQFKLYQNYPNPFNPTTTISWQIPVAGQVSLKIYDVLGKEVVALVDEFREAGAYCNQLSVSNGQLTSGIYIYKLTVGKFSESKKLVILK